MLGAGEGGQPKSPDWDEQAEHIRYHIYHGSCVWVERVAPGLIAPMEH